MYPLTHKFYLKYALNLILSCPSANLFGGDKILNFIPLWEWLWYPCISYGKQSWVICARSVLSGCRKYASDYKKTQLNSAVQAESVFSRYMLSRCGIKFAGAVEVKWFVLLCVWEFITSLIDMNTSLLPSYWSKESPSNMKPY